MHNNEKLNNAILLDTVYVDDIGYDIILIKTDIINKEDNLQYLLSYAKNHVKENDLVFISEKVISIIQGRIIHEKDIEVSKIARFLSKYVTKNPGANLTNPAAMQVAIDQVGLLRILIASVFAAIFRIFNIRGIFYKIAGEDVRGIDASSPYTVKPYRNTISLAPLNPDIMAKKSSLILNVDVCILDANYRGINIIGCSNKNTDTQIFKKVLKNNPMGQKDEQTPICIVRKV